MNVMKVLRICETAFRVYVSGFDFRAAKISKKANTKQVVVNRVMHGILDVNIFISLADHDTDHDLGTEDMHSTQLCRTIAERYCDIRLFNHAKFYNENVINKGKLGMRQQSNKLVLFKGL